MDTSTRSLLLGAGALALALLAVLHLWMLTVWATAGWPMYGGTGGMMAPWGATMRHGVMATSPWNWLVWATPVALLLLGALLFAKAALTSAGK